MRDDEYPTPVSDPEAGGLPETADPDSRADEFMLSVRIADGPQPAALPPERGDGPLGLDEYGASTGTGLRGEGLSARLRREQPEVPLRLDPDPWLAEEADPDALDQMSDDSVTLAQDADIAPNLGSAVSVFDRTVAGVPTLATVGRLVEPDEGGPATTEADVIAYDAGIAGGGPSAEESAMHLIEPDTADGEDEPDIAARPDVSR